MTPQIVRSGRSEMQVPSQTSPSRYHCSAPPLLLLLLVALLGLASLPACSSLDFPSPCSQPTSDSCPTCCKNLRNLAPAGNPALVVRNVRHVDRCIALCSNHTFYGLSNRHVCGCFDECSAVEVPPSPFSVVSGYVKACLSTCFDPEPSSARCQCPQHATCLLGKDNTHKCCCKAPFDQLTEVDGRMLCTRSKGWDEEQDIL